MLHLRLISQSSSDDTKIEQVGGIEGSYFLATRSFLSAVTSFPNCTYAVVSCEMRHNQCHRTKLGSLHRIPWTELAHRNKFLPKESIRVAVVANNELLPCGMT